MFGHGGLVKVFVATRPVDFRKGIDGLARAVQEMFGMDPCCGAAFVFRAKRADRIKLVSSLIRWLGQVPVARIVFEPTGPYHRACTGDYAVPDPIGPACVAHVRTWSGASMNWMSKHCPAGKPGPSVSVRPSFRLAEPGGATSVAASNPNTPLTVG